MTYLQLNKTDSGKIKDGMTSDFWAFIKSYMEERKERLKSGILSGVSEDRSKTIYNKRDLELKELELIDEFLEIPNFLLTRISNNTDISVEDDH